MYLLHTERSKVVLGELLVDPLTRHEFGEGLSINHSVIVLWRITHASPRAIDREASHMLHMWLQTVP